MEKKNGCELRRYAWDYFHFHASQRLTTFNFYLIVSAVLVTGYVASVKAGTNAPVRVILGLLLTLMSFVFWKLDVRNRQLIHNAEDALKQLEAELGPEDDPGEPQVTAIFRYEQMATDKLKTAQSKWPWLRFFSYYDCFKLIFRTFALLGVAAAAYSVVPGQAPAGMGRLEGRILGLTQEVTELRKTEEGIAARLAELERIIEHPETGAVVEQTNQAPAPQGGSIAPSPVPATRPGQGISVRGNCPDR